MYSEEEVLSLLGLTGIEGLNNIINLLKHPLIIISNEDKNKNLIFIKKLEEEINKQELFKKSIENRLITLSTYYK